MIQSNEQGYHEFLQPTVSGWLGKVREAIRHKKPFDDVAGQCMEFYSGPVGFLWQSEFLKRFVKGSLAPRFQVTVQKAFELVALFGPSLFWRNPTRIVRPRKAIEIDLAALGMNPAMMGGMTPEGWMLQQAMMQRQQDQSVDRTVAALLEGYLNYSSVEQPGGGLANHSSQAITEALIKGRGCLWPKPYQMPGSPRVLTGCFYDSVDNLLIDPDATNLQDARWIAQRVIEPKHLVERQYQLQPGTLDGAGMYESAWRQGESITDPMHDMERRTGRTCDLVTYYKIYSKVGVGGRLAGPPWLGQPLGEALDRVVGDYAYIVVCPHVPYPLNAPSERIRSASDPEVERMFRWPIPYWLDDRWPVAMLDFYTKPQSAWPIAPMAPGLGELTAIQIILSHLMNRIWMTSRTFVAASSTLPPEVENAFLAGNDLAFLKLDAFQDKEIDRLIKFIQYPETNLDVWQVLDRLMEMFDRRTGLTELVYGLSPGGTQSRTAEDIATKREMVSIRPDYMAGRVEDWQTHVADMEKLCVRWFVEAQDLQGMYGPLEQMLWQQHINARDPELVVREMRATVAANSTRKPDKIRDVQNANQLVPTLLPFYQQLYAQTGDPSQLNNLIAMWGQAMDQDTSGLQVGPLNLAGAQQQGAEAERLQQEQLAQEHQQKLQQRDDEHRQRMEQRGQQAQQQVALQQLRMQMQPMMGAAPVAA